MIGVVMEPQHGCRSRLTEREVRPVGPACRVVLAGRPGAGKGTQGARLAERLGVQYLSTGDLLRAEITARSPLGRAIEGVVNAGDLIPTALIMAMVDSCIDSDGYVLDGFPRTVEQAVAITAHEGLAPHIAIEIVVPAQVALSRLTSRGRSDDDVNIACRRLAVYDTETAPMLSYLAGHDLLRRVDGNDGPDLVERRVWAAVEPLIGTRRTHPANPVAFGLPTGTTAFVAAG